MTPEHKALVERLNAGGCKENMGCHPDVCLCAWCGDAADAIEALAARLEHMEEESRVYRDTNKMLHAKIEAAEAKLAAVLDVLGFDPEEILQAHAAPKPKDAP